jgi:hypothetical protein
LKNTGISALSQVNLFSDFKIPADSTAVETHPIFSCSFPKVCEIARTWDNSGISASLKLQLYKIVTMDDNKFTKEGIAIITCDVINEHINDIEKSKKEGTFINLSNDIMKLIIEENPNFSLEVIQSTLESDKSEEYKKGYLAGIATLYDLLRKQGRKSRRQS